MVAAKREGNALSPLKSLQGSFEEQSNTNSPEQNVMCVRRAYEVQHVARQIPHLRAGGRGGGLGK